MKVVTLYDNRMKEIGEKCVSSIISHYGSSDTIVFTELLEDKIHPSWNKLLAVNRVMETCQDDELVIWIDADCLVLRKLPGDWFAGSEKDSVLFPSSDWNGLCMGVFAAYTCEKASWILDTLIRLGDVTNDDYYGKGLGPKWEQNALKALERSYTSVKRSIRTMPVEWVNDQPQNDRDKKAYIHHFGGRTNNERLKMMNSNQYR